MENIPCITQSFDWSLFDYPIDSFKCEDGHWDCHPVLNEEPYPNDINELLDCTKYSVVYHFRPGANDEESWEFVVRHQNGYYIWFDASCDYTGFDCQGCGTIVYSNDPNSFWNLGLDNYMREILSQTQRA